MKNLKQCIKESFTESDLNKITKRLEYLNYVKSDDEREIAAPAGNQYYMKNPNDIIFTKGDGNFVFKIINNNNEYSLIKIDNNDTETTLYSENNINKFMQKLS